MFDIFIESSQCKHIVFAGCHDHGYLSLLTPHKKEKRRITLLKTAPCSTRFQALGFPTTEFRDVFRSEHLSAVTGFPNGAEVRQMSPSTSGPNGAPRHRKSSPDTGTKPPRSLGKMIHLNKDYQRIDPPLPAATESGKVGYARRVRVKQFCHDYQLLGRCLSASCSFDHEPVAPELLLILKHQLRKLPCVQRLSCRSFDCYYGHTCPEQGCGRGKRCKFGALQHDVDNTTVRVL